MLRTKQILSSVFLSLLVAFSYTPPVIASQATSSNYGVSEVQFGSGGELRACSTTYCAKQSAGETAVGNTRSTNYQAQAGFNTDRQPLLEVVVSGSTVNLGELTPGATASGSTTFTVRNYLSSGYYVALDGSSPRAKTGHILTAMSSAGPAQTGIEQFGVNLRQNTAPSVGADPVQVPSSTFSFATPSTGYDTVNSYKYVAGDTIAASASSSGETDFTLAMIANIATTTPSGVYGGKLILNVVPTF